VSNLGATFRGKAVVEAATSVTIYNKSIPTANTEVSQALATGTKRFTIKLRGIAKLQLAFVSTESGTKYITIHPGAVYSENDLNFGGTLYFQASRDSQTAEIIEWS